MMEKQAENCILIFDNVQAKKIQNTKGISNIDNVDNVVINGGCSTVEGVIASVNAEEKESYRGAGNAGLHEEGGDSRLDANGRILVEAWNSGATISSNQNGAIDPFSGVRIFSSMSQIGDIWHIHTSGTTYSTDTEGNSVLNHAAPGPSPKDRVYQMGLETGRYKRTAIQVDTYGIKRVNFYNSSGTVHSMKYSAFKLLDK